MIEQTPIYLRARPSAPFASLAAVALECNGSGVSSMDEQKDVLTNTAPSRPSYRWPSPARRRHHPHSRMSFSGRRMPGGRGAGRRSPTTTSCTGRAR